MNNSTSKWVTIGIPVALILICLATLVPFFISNEAWAMTAYPYVYSVGAVMMLIIRLFTPYKGSDMRLKRLHRIEGWSAIFFCVAAFFLFYPGSHLRDWIAFTLAAAIIHIYTSLAIPFREEKVARESSNRK